MKSKSLFFVLLLLLILLLIVSLSFVSASSGFFSDIWNKIMGKNITGKAIDFNNGLMAYWKFDEGSGATVSDSSANMNTGTISGATWTAGKSGNALSFDGTNDYVSIQLNGNLDLFKGASGATISLWVYIKDDAKRKFMFHDTWASSGLTRVRLEVQASETIIIAARDTSDATQQTITTSSAVSTGEWHHIVGVYDIANDNLEIYVDGSLPAQTGTSSFTTTTFGPDSTTWTNIAAQAGTNNYYFNGSIDEVMIFNRVLTNQEILDYYNSFIIQTFQCNDNDNDGYNQSKTGCGTADCDDIIAAINPGATEICGNGIDENCNSVDDACQTDNDKDSVINDSDCNDNNISIRECIGCTVCNTTTVGIENGACVFDIPKPLMQKYKNSITTNLTNKNLLNSISNFNIGIPDVSKIEFTENVKLFRNVSSVCQIMDFDSYINISAGKVDINSNELPELNKSAVITMYNISLINPYIIIDGKKCDECLVMSYINNNLVFNVPHFTIYEVRGCGDGICDSAAGEICGATDNAPECNTDCSICSAPSGDGGGSSGGGGGGGGSPTPSKNFSLSIDDVSFKLSQGESKSVSFSITNTGDSSSNFNINSNLMEITFSESTFSLAKGQSKTINANVNLDENKSYGIYVGKIYIKSGSMTKEISVSIEVVSADSLFDVVLIIPDEYLSVLPGENILGEVTLTRLGGLSGISRVVLNYIIEDEHGNILLSENEQKDIEETSTNINKEFIIPKDEEYGKYVLYVQLKYEEKVASASKWFNVGTKSKLVGVMFWFVVVVVILIISIAFVILVIYLKDIKKDYKIIKKES